MEDFFRRSLKDMHAQMRSGVFTPLDLLTHYEKRIEALDPVLNTFVAVNPEAENEAAASTDRYKEGEPLGPLDGIPCTIKDSIPTLGMPCTWGSAVLLDNLPENEEPVVSRLREAGAVILGKTNCPEFTLEGYTGNASFGVTRNPWNPQLTPGGSSGGAVAGVAGGLAAYAIGTDGGGSIRRPAGHTGLVGLKPSIGRIARQHTLPAVMFDLEVVGPITRRVEDCATIFEVIKGPLCADPRSHIKSQLAPSPGPQRILLAERFGDNPVDPKILDAVRDAAQQLEALGHKVERGPMPLDIDSVQAHWPLVGQTGLAWLKQQLGDRFQVAGDAYQKIAKAGESRSAAEYLGLMNAIQNLRSRAAELFDSIDIIMTPTAAAQPWQAGEVYPSMIDGQEVGPRGHAVFTGWVNAIGHPAIALPAKPDENGLPIGYQLIGGFGEEAKLLTLAAEIEQANGWADNWPSMALDF